MAIEPNRAPVPLLLKILLTVFVVVLVSQYWKNYGPANFLWFCDFGLVMTALAVWVESPLLISMEALALTFSDPCPLTGS